MSADIAKMSNFVWSVAETLRGDFKQSEYGKVILPFVVLRRLDCILEDSKESVLEAHNSLSPDVDDATREIVLLEAAGVNINTYNTSNFTIEKIKSQDLSQLHSNLTSYIMGFSPDVTEIFEEKFRFFEQLKRLKEAGILWSVFDKFTEIDLHPRSVSNIEMGQFFEDLIRRFSEISNETAGEHFTPREVIQLIVDLLIVKTSPEVFEKGIIRQIYDPACGTGGMLTLAEETLKEHNSDITVELFGQEINPESYGVCKSDMLVTGHDPNKIAFGNTLTNDRHAKRKFHYIMSNPPYGVDWKKYKDSVIDERDTKGGRGRFGAGTPRFSDGQLLFLQHMISKMRDDKIGSRIGIVMNGSPLYTGKPESGENNIRRWILENDWLEAVIALPTDLFYNTGIQTYIWILTNRKSKKCKDKILLINASSSKFWEPMRKSLGAKRRKISQRSRKHIEEIYAKFLRGGGGDPRFQRQ